MFLSSDDLHVMADLGAIDKAAAARASMPRQRSPPTQLRQLIRNQNKHLRQTHNKTQHELQKLHKKMCSKNIYLCGTATKAVRF